MKRRKIKYSDQRNVAACIEQLQALIDGLTVGSISVTHDGEAVQLEPANAVEFELRVDQQQRRETLRLEMSWPRDTAPRPEAASDADPVISATGPLSSPAAVRALTASNGDGHGEARALAGLAAGEYQQLFAAARTRGSDGRWHIDQDRLMQSLALAGVDALTQQELYALALQADADGSASLFNDRVIAALEQASQHPPPASSGSSTAMP